MLARRVGALLADDMADARSPIERYAVTDVTDGEFPGAPTPAMIEAAAREIYLYAWGWDRPTIGEQQAREQEAVKTRCRTLAAAVVRSALTAPEGQYKATP